MVDGPESFQKCADINPFMNCNVIVSTTPRHDNRSKGSGRTSRQLPEWGDAHPAIGPRLINPMVGRIRRQTGMTFQYKIRSESVASGHLQLAGIDLLHSGLSATYTHPSQTWPFTHPTSRSTRPGKVTSTALIWSTNRANDTRATHGLYRRPAGGVPSAHRLFPGRRGKDQSAGRCPRTSPARSSKDPGGVAEAAPCDSAVG